MSDVIVIATTNSDKFREIEGLLRDDAPFVFRCLNDYPPLPEPEEDGKTFFENALKKALYYCHELKLPCVCDDSGLEVEALNGAPGVHSARYAGVPSSSERNNEKLLEQLRGVAENDRRARFVCCAMICFPDGRIHAETGTVEGRIADRCRGNHGFGYDPLFIPEGYNLTFGELDPEIKKAISHRARAFHKLRDYLRSL
ncbi:MAG TPA: RdgB/HAM1 family non-canonical purine NTP pyrophosphatase [Candidatus Hydrogenedentes bacterium]|nr:RdgB/HAM1 family non-canonical purine NTP pyrophosphatase [Candidatus Hydrogenedentota bacterium]HOL77559.1 RdgB/HAM1 family non-canonical purine NTP pyrophosphatase [Candidatus Hydrogenedentota bacterium]HPO84864.1 RdgB/HAM1 family non-canonical purine NTP pyrophosphatase [Candidatus Hydrogenedentota bacterium]